MFVLCFCDLDLAGVTMGLITRTPRLVTLSKTVKPKFVNGDLRLLPFSSSTQMDYLALVSSDKPSGLLRLPNDKALLNEPVFHPLVEKYAADEGAFFEDYKEAHLKLSELGKD
ncbi:unnamed protein product [Rhodiola kirilowii]